MSLWHHLASRPTVDLLIAAVLLVLAAGCFVWPHRAELVREIRYRWLWRQRERAMARGRRR